MPANMGLEESKGVTKPMTATTKAKSALKAQHKKSQEDEEETTAKRRKTRTLYRTRGYLLS
jgi:hypothetical protein